MSDLPQPDRDRFQPLRAGIINVWEYDDERLAFHRGRLLLRGRNESGKTKALELLFPFLFDADLSAPRLDPFGSTSRSMYWNLFNEQTPAEVQKRVGYLFLEFGRRGDRGDEYYTIGAGLSGKRSARDVDAWFFTTELRVDEALRLLDERRVPLSRAGLQESLGGRGRIYERREEYRRGLGERLFGGMPKEQYGYLVEMILQLRRPQLSKQLDPQGLSRLLARSLPQLDAAKIAPLAEGFERLDRHRREREVLETTLSELDRFLKEYRRYAGAVARAAAQELTRAEYAHRLAREELRERVGAAQAAQSTLDELAGMIEVMSAQEATLEERLATMRSSDQYRAVEELASAERQAARDARRAAAAEEQLREDRLRQETLTTALAEVRTSAEAATRALHASQADSAERARAAALEGENLAVAEQAARGDLAAARGALRVLLAKREDAIGAVTFEQQRVREAGHALDAARARRGEAEERLEALLDQVRAAERHAAEAGAALRAAARRWAEGLSVLHADEALLGALADDPIEDLRPRAEALAASARAALLEASAVRRAEREGLAQHSARLAAEREALAEATHALPAAPAWRPARPADRPGAPLFLLCDFRPGLAPAQQALLEAALEASGLLDAWLSPAGVLLDPATQDVLLVPRPRRGPTLADVLLATPTAAVQEERIEAALRSIALWEGEAPPAVDDTPCWIARDGRFGLGPILGAHRRERAAFIGATARAQERARRIEALDGQLRALRERLDHLDEALAAIAERGQLLEDELRRFPALAPLRAAQAAASALAAQVPPARAALERADGAYTKAQEALRGRIATRDATAGRLGLVGFVDRLEELRQLTHAYRDSSSDLLEAARALHEVRRRCDEGESAVADATRRAEGTQAQAEEARRDVARLEARVDALQQLLGSERDAILRELRDREREREELRRKLLHAQKERSVADRRVGESSQAAEAARRHAEEAAERRGEAEQAFKALAAGPILPLVGVGLPREPARWGLTETIEHARLVDATLGDADPGPAARERLENRVTARHQELMQALPGEIRLSPQREEGVLRYDALRNGRRLLLLELEDELGAEVRERERLLATEEEELFRSFLRGELHEHLRQRLLDAHELLRTITEHLKVHRTASGMKVRLDWDIVPEAPPGTRAALELMLRDGGLLSERDQETLRSFLRQRLAAAQTDDGQGSLLERMLTALDYRDWYAFRVLISRPGFDGGWEPLTKKTHGAGSGGQKAVMLHMPLFAAAKAYYQSAGPVAPRLIALDEAFAGIDREMRGELMGLLSAFDLDFILTSHEEWGCYEQVEGLSIYHLRREPALPGVYLERFLWDGRRRTEVGA